MRLTCLMVLAFCARLLAQPTPADSIYLRMNYTKREVMIPMCDGVQLFTSIYTPKNASTAYPMLLKRTPYSCAPYGENAFPITFQNRYLAQCRCRAAGFRWPTAIRKNLPISIRPGTVTLKKQPLPSCILI